MIKTRIFPVKLRYLFLLALLVLITWQVFKYTTSNTYLSVKSNRNSADVLTSIRESSNKSHVLISVYYEALCPDSRGFFIRHLQPTYSRMLDAIEIELIPYGKAKTKQIDDNRFTFDCQHGNVECLANKIHACAIHYIQDFTLLLQFVTCMIENNDDPEAIGLECSSKFEIPWKPILNCANGPQGNWLLKKHGEQTNNLSPPIAFVPTVLLNKNHHNQALILKDLYKSICSYYQDVVPKSCDS